VNFQKGGKGCEFSKGERGGEGRGGSVNFQKGGKGCEFSEGGGEGV
jgi:hypothetical protein